MTSTWRRRLEVGGGTCLRAPPIRGLQVITGRRLFVSSSRPGSIYGFNVAVNRSIEQLAAKRGVPLRLHNVIYKLFDQLKDELGSKLPPLVTEDVIGESAHTARRPRPLLHMSTHL